LLVIQFKVDGIVSKTGKRFRVSAGRNSNVRTNSGKSGMDVGKLDHVAVAIILHACSFRVMSAHL
jgi:hypothetical protein